MQVVVVYLKPFRCNLLLKCVLQPKIAKKITKNPNFGNSRSFKVVDLDVNRKGVWNFLLVINSNLGPISHCFWDTATYWLKIVIFCTPLSFSALDRGDPFRIPGQALRILKLESFWQSTVKISWSQLALRWRNTGVWQTDKGRTPRRWLRCAKHYMLSRVKTVRFHRSSKFTERAI